MNNILHKRTSWTGLFFSFVAGAILVAAGLTYVYFTYLQAEPIKPNLTEEQLWAKEHPEAIDWMIRRYDAWMAVQDAGIERVKTEVQMNLYADDNPASPEAVIKK